MKIILSEQQIKTLMDVDELKNVPKKKIGSGMFHNVFPSTHNPHIVYKIGMTRSVDEWVDIFKGRPDLFPKIYGKGKTMYEGNEYSYAVVEKLNTKRAEQEWSRISAFFYDFDEDFQILVMYGYYDRIDTVLIDMKRMEPDLYEICEKYLSLVQRVEDYSGKKDSHGGQFGYDNKGNLKCLDI